ncbi:hypothetical protein GOV05_00570 [Candidatus Woesearchaeota archaeon]|nr:hypothetical protein [Candidatus Woesearchaeota archaeon]
MVEDYSEYDLYEEESIYSDSGREKLLEDGEISLSEYAFMKGYDEAMG